MDENQKSKFLACSEELCQLDPLALSAHRPYPRNSPLCSGNEPVLAAVGSLCASHHFSTQELLLVFASLNSFPHPSWLGGSVHHKNPAEREESGFCNSPAAIRCLQNVAETLQGKRKKIKNNQPQSSVALLRGGRGGSVCKQLILNGIKSHSAVQNREKTALRTEVWLIGWDRGHVKGD